MLAIGCGGNADRATDAGNVIVDANTAGPDADGSARGDGNRGAGDVADDAAAASAPDDAAPPDSGPPIADAFVADRGPDAPGILIHVANNCPFTLWILGTGVGATLNPDTSNIDDFVKLVRARDLHAGLVLLEESGRTREEQLQRVRRALQLIAADAGGDMANKALRLAGEYGYAFEETPVF